MTEQVAYPCTSGSGRVHQVRQRVRQRLPAEVQQPVVEDGGRGAAVGQHYQVHVAVAVAFNGETVHHRFGPGTTVARVKTWAAERKFGMTPQEAGEHVLQIAGTKDRPDPGTHLGSIASCPDCRIAFDLVPNERVNGWGDAR